jgi:transposase-like protein
MTAMESGSEILKVDEVGRVRTPPEKREAMLAEYERSGMTGAQFARFVGVRYSTLMYWLQKRRKQTSQGGEEKANWRKDHPRWLEASVAGEGRHSEELVVEIDGGIRMLVSNRTQAALAGEVLRTMGLGRGC